MNNPENMRTLLTANPQMQELIERNPEINHMLNNPELLRQTMELARNPSMLQELMRSHDRAMSNLESIPGGFNELQRMYRDIQEPMLNAATEQFGSNPFAGLASGNGGNSNPQQVLSYILNEYVIYSDVKQGTENREPLPNPWSAATPRTDATTTQSTPRQPPLFSNMNMSSLMQQMAENPQTIQNMMSAPYTQTMLQALSADPNMANRILSDVPLIAGNPEMQEQMRRMMPQLLQQMQNPEVQNLVTNPQALNALMQIQQGMETLRQTAPSLMTNLGGMGGLAPTATTTTPAPTTTTTTTTTGSAPTTAPPTGGSDAFSEFMARMVAGMLREFSQFLFLL